MMTVEEASSLIRSKIKDFGTEEIALDESLGRVLREPIIADRDFPPYDRVTMDGIAIRFSNFEKGQHDFEIEAVAAAGAEKLSLIDTDKCLEVMTGAIMPDGVDTVIPYEQVEIENGKATLQTKEINHRQNIHFQGLDRKKDTVIIEPGKVISSVEIGICSTVGKARVKVSKLPKTVIISSGDELVPIDQQPLPHQIRASNVYRLKTVFKGYGAPVTTAHLKDDYDEIVNSLKHYLRDYELVILSGGVSKGKFDYLPQALDEIGVEKHFHKIKQRPGKPFWFGTFKDQATVFAFPGNPVSSFMCMHQYFKPWLNACLNISGEVQPMAVLSDDVTFLPDLTYFLEVKLSYNEEGKLLAHPVKGNGSGDFANLTDADAFIILPRGKNEFFKGEVYPVLLYR